MTGQTACIIWKAAAEPVLSNFDNLSLEKLRGAAEVLAPLKIALRGEVVHDENGALSIIARDYATLSAHVQWRESLHPGSCTTTHGSN